MTLLITLFFGIPLSLAAIGGAVRMYQLDYGTDWRSHLMRDIKEHDLAIKDVIRVPIDLCVLMWLYPHLEQVWQASSYDDIERRRAARRELEREKEDQGYVVYDSGPEVERSWGSWI